ncbi:uncharacterized protein LOC116243224 [Phasianus colchicus]|uniref:uncharacterized protein LOC116243224 n=1 Tax=Phasianus colchicus TaxID=9054 RepID=UPI00129D39FE|nr:uncharacterized protein LOC116243224 [Phasianus colchicus]
MSHLIRGNKVPTRTTPESNFKNSDLRRSSLIAQFSEATGFSAPTPTRLRARSRSRHTRATLTLSGIKAFLRKNKNETVRRCAFRKGRVRPRHGAIPPGLTARRRSRHFSFRTKRPTGGSTEAAGRARRPTFRGSPAARPLARSSARRPRPAGLPPPLRHGASSQPRPGAAGAALRSHRAEDAAERRTPRAPPRPGCGAPPPRRARSRSCARGRPVPARPALPPGGAGTAAAPRGTHRRSQGLSPALPSASAPGTPRLHPLGGRSSLCVSFPAPPRARHSGALSRPGRLAEPTARLVTRGRSAAAAAAPLFAAALTAAGGDARPRAALPLGTRPQDGGGNASRPRLAPLCSSPRSLPPRSAIGGGRSSGRRPGNSSAAAARGAPTGSESPSRGRARGGAGAGRAIRRGACGRRPRRDDEAAVGGAEEGKGTRRGRGGGGGAGSGRRAAGAGPPLRPAPLRAAGASRCPGPRVVEGSSGTARRRCGA